LGEIGFEGADRSEGFADGVAVLLEGCPVFGCVNDDLAGKAVSEGIQGRAFFAFRGLRAGRELGVTPLHNSFQPIPFQIKVDGRMSPPCSISEVLAMHG